MQLAAFIASRVAFNQQHSFSRFIIRLAMVATILSVAVMIVAFGVTNGFQQTISQKIFNFWGHLRVQHFQPQRVAVAEELPIEKNDTVVQVLQQTNNITSVNSFATKNAILKTSETIEGILFKGVESNYNFKQLQPFLQQGRWMQYPDSGYSNEIVLSASTASQLQVKLGDALLIYFIQNDGTAPRARKLSICGIYKTGIEEYDKLIALGDLRLVQRLNNWQPNQIGGYEIFIDDYKKMDAVNETIFYQLPKEWNSHTIKEVYPNIFDWLGLQNKTILLVLIIMTIVAVLNLVTCLIILVLERTRMVGVLKALGAPNKTVQGVFLYQGAFITGAGILLGNLLALLLIWLQQRYGIIKLQEEMYYISKAVIETEWWHFVVVNLGVFVVCLLVLLIPTIIVRKIQPVKAIQFR
ncbi:MAG: FtsX-like permease family protein [Flavihumibacter sp.]|nr:FtsX-like permease family protein [Flavihumibacter sp.]